MIVKLHPTGVPKVDQGLTSVFVVGEATRCRRSRWVRLQMSLYGAIASFVLAGIMAILVGLGFWHARRVPESARLVVHAAAHSERCYSALWIPRVGLKQPSAQGPESRRSDVPP